ncbi:MAG: tetratricopeptide repeat protein [Gammaproteobacteria bacterium]
MFQSAPKIQVKAASGPSGQLNHHCVALIVGLTISMSSLHSLAQSEDSVFSQTQPFDNDASVVADSKSFNVYHAESLEPLIDLGLMMQEQDRHEEAVDYFKQARQVSRIQKGLFDETQILLVEAIIESELALKNWEAVDDHYQHVEYLYHKLYDMDDPELEAGLGKVSRWLSYSLSANPVGNRIDQLYRAKRVYKLRLQIAQRTLDADHPKLAYLQENIAICDKQLYPMPSPSREGTRSIRDGRSRIPIVASLN